MIVGTEARAANYNVSNYAACDGVADDTNALQGLLDIALPNSSIHFDAPGGIAPKCRVSSALLIERPMHLYGTHPFTEIHRIRIPGYPIKEYGFARGSIIWIQSSNVTVEGLGLIGYAYGEPSRPYMHGIYAWNENTRVRISNITLRDLRVRRLHGLGITVRNVDDFIIEDCHVEDVGRAGIFTEGSRRGWIRGNTVTDIGDPTRCDPLSLCRINSTYGIVVTGCGGLPCSSDTLVSNNVVREVETWVGIMNHGADRVLIFDNEVYDTNFLYANTTRPHLIYPEASDDTSFINNYGDTLPRSVGGRYDTWSAASHGEGIWFFASSPYPSHRVHAIGNIFRNTGAAGANGGATIWSNVDARFTWNRIENDPRYPPPRYGVWLANTPDDKHMRFEHRSERLIVAHNEIVSGDAAIRSDSFLSQETLVASNQLSASSIGIDIQTGGTWDIQGNNVVAPTAIQGGYTPWTAPTSNVLAPSQLVALPMGNGKVRLEWSYGQPPHDSFYIEFRSGFSGWRRLAFRPPNDPKWTFDAPTNPAWESFDPLSHNVEGLTAGVVTQFRIRANDGANFSAWSAIATVRVL